jgi:hypothetical protein
MPVKFRYPIYNPCHRALDVAQDWNIDPACVTTDLEVVRQQPYKIAALRVFYNQPFVYSFDPEVAKVNASEFDFVILSDAEYNKPHDIQAWINSQGITNYVLAQGGKYHDYVPDANNTVYRSFWLPRFLQVNTDQNTNTDHKPFLFDALLGARRPNRDFIMLAAKHHDLLDQSVVTYREGFPGGFVDFHSELVANLYPEIVLDYPYVSPNLNPAWEPGPVTSNTISPLVPHDIYRNTWYSVLCETISIGQDFFFSEKIMKALYARRLFVHFGAQNFLQHLHTLGFETFGDVIDESYDQTVPSVVRFQQAFDQIVALSQGDHASLYKKLAPRLEHNHNHLIAQKNKSHQDMAALLMQHLAPVIDQSLS